MPSQFAALDTGFPTFTGGETTEQKVKDLHDYLYMLLEYLRYILHNITPENLNTAEVVKWMVTGGEDAGEIKQIVNQIAQTTINQGGIIPQVLPQVLETTNIITQEIYADYGMIADLTVDELRTDWKRAQRYLSSNTGDLDYLHIHDEEIDFFTATVKTSGGTPLTEQLHHGDTYYYWTGPDRTRMQTEATAYPVTVYQYDELLKGTYRFDTVTEGGETVKIPELVFGAGYGMQEDADRGKGFLRKNPNSFDLWLVNRFGVRQGLFIGDPSGGGYTDIVGMRKPTELDFSGWDAGTFTETLDGNMEATFEIDFDAQDRPVKFTDGDGHETVVTWDAV